MRLTLRRGGPDDAEPCGLICHRAFAELHTRHGFAPLFPGPEITIDLARALLADPAVYAVVAESDSGIVGSNFLHEHAGIAGVGPTTVDPRAQSAGVGRAMMEAVLARAGEIGAADVRLVQETYNTRSFALYTRLGFSVREPLAILRGRPLRRQTAGYGVRAAGEADIEACSAVARRVHGHDRAVELAAAVARGTASVVERRGRVTGYTSGLGFRGHSVGETNGDLKALIAASAAVIGAGIFVPTRNGDLMRWCLDNGFEVVSPATLMSIGLYVEPNGVFLPSVIF